MRRLALVLALSFAALAQADVAPSRRPAPSPPECRADTECVVTTFEGCCGACCRRAPYAMNATRLKALQEQECAAVRCARLDCAAIACAAVVPEPTSSFRAVCEAGRCVARPAAAVAECRNSAECAVVQTQPAPGAACYGSPCGCCPVNVAMPVERTRPAPGPTSPPAKKDGKEATPAFGLSTGKPAGSAPSPRPPDAVNCSACPEPPQADAECVAGKCTLVPVRPRPRPLPPG